MGILCSKLEVCLPLAYPSTIYKHFSSLKPLNKICVFQGSLYSLLRVLLPRTQNGSISRHHSSLPKQSPGLILQKMSHGPPCFTTIFRRLCVAQLVVLSNRHLILGARRQHLVRFSANFKSIRLRKMLAECPNFKPGQFHQIDYQLFVRPGPSKLEPQPILTLYKDPMLKKKHCGPLLSV